MRENFFGLNNDVARRLTAAGLQDAAGGHAIKGVAFENEQAREKRRYYFVQFIKLRIT